MCAMACCALQHIWINVKNYKRNLSSFKNQSNYKWKRPKPLVIQQASQFFPLLLTLLGKFTIKSFSKKFWDIPLDPISRQILINIYTLKMTKNQYPDIKLKQEICFEIYSWVAHIKDKQGFYLEETWNLLSASRTKKGWNQFQPNVKDPRKLLPKLSFLFLRAVLSNPS